MGKYLDILARAETCDESDKSDKSPPPVVQQSLVAYIALVALSPLWKPAAPTAFRPIDGNKPLRTEEHSWLTGANKHRLSGGRPGIYSACSPCRRTPSPVLIGSPATMKWD
jgi:hypothetical protein